MNSTALANATKIAPKKRKTTLRSSIPGKNTARFFRYLSTAINYLMCKDHTLKYEWA